MKSSTGLRVTAAAALSITLITAGCGDSGDPAAAGPSGPASTAPNDDYTEGAEPAPTLAPPKKVGETVEVAGLKIQLVALKAASKTSLDPTSIDKPASWRGFTATYKIHNGTGQPVKLTGSTHSVTTDPNDTEAAGIMMDEPGTAGTETLGDGPLLPGKTRLISSGLVAPSLTGIVVELTPEITPAPPQPVDPITWTGTAR
ncbi:hypothetical protein E1264_38640 [Actinomadura sp. KC216]|uniref:hypothetical protein n=1 Tax=Actinomadura sp. KC216 TaxID=2530370 RepID=UPI0010D5A489|nr:hypothetical protein [Actinomadura sp. KC216]TDB76373.1 hypothetical protein E1264_38640 [Actinomadura sp. KC216]